MASTVDICNGALQLLGEVLIADLTEESTAARMCNAAWDRVRKSMIRSHSWNSTTIRVEIAKLVSTPAWGWDFEYELPADCLIVFDINAEDSQSGWRVEGRKLLTDVDAPLGILYGKDETDSQQFDAMLTEALSIAMAAEMAESITQSNTKKQELEARLERHLSKSRQVDGWEQTPADFEEDPWILARWRR